MRRFVDLSIARGLDYYTGTVFERFLTDLHGIGSICSGGRYDNLAGLYTKQLLPGVGASLGLDRRRGRPRALDRLPARAAERGHPRRFQHHGLAARIWAADHQHSLFTTE